MRTETFKKVGISVRYTEEDMTYDEAMEHAPKGWRLIKPSEAMKIFEKYPTVFGFWFWCESPEWNKKNWRPVSRDGSLSRFDLGSYYYYFPRASRGVYVKKVKNAS
jgi:hypothetical protein